MMRRTLLLVLLALLVYGSYWYFFSDRNADIPKPRGYFRIDLPEKKYELHQFSCPIQFDIPLYSHVELFKEHISVDSCWFNIFFPGQNARLHCTYMPVGKNLGELLRDSYGFAAKHEMKASALKRTMINDSTNHVYGIVYDIEGDAASQLQFFLTDSVNHFLRGSLYFYNTPNTDSIAPVLSFLREDVMHITNSIHWK